MEIIEREGSMQNSAVHKGIYKEACAAYAQANIHTYPHKSGQSVKQWDECCKVSKYEYPF